MMRLPDAYLEIMQALLQDNFSNYLACLEEAPYRGYRINPLKVDEETFFHEVPFPNEKHPFCKNGYYFTKDEKSSDYVAYYAGLFYPQEPSASSAVNELDICENMVVLDLCAAPGSKSTQIAEILKGTGYLVANDVDRKRAGILLENITRHGIQNAIVLNASMQQIQETFQEQFDAVLCDAPCSGEGMFRKEEAAITQWSIAHVQKCVQMQTIALDTAYQALKQGGILVYSTCTFNPMENEEQINRFIARHRDMEIVTQRRIFPMDKGEGHFVCKLKKGKENERKAFTLLPTSAKQFLNAHLEQDYPYYYVHQNEVYGGFQPFLDLKHLNVLNQQVYLGEVKKDIFIPSFALALSGNLKKEYQIELSLEEVQHYLHGDTIAQKKEKGFYVVTYHHFPLGFVKSDGAMLKNHYPKHLRIKENKKLL